MGILAGQGISITSSIPVENITGLGTGVATALAINVGSPGAFLTASSGAANLTIGTSTITSGTSGRILFDNAGVVGESANLTFTGGNLLAANGSMVIGANGAVNAYVSGGAQAIDMPGMSILSTSGGSGNSYLSANAYFNISGTPKYRATNVAAQLALENGNVVLRSAVSGTAGNTVTWADSLTASTTGVSVAGGITASGVLAIGNTVTAGIAVASTSKVSILIGGVQYYLLASNV